MEQEITDQSTSFSNVDFYSLMDTPGDINLDVVREEDPKSVKKDSSGFIFAGIVSLIAGAGIFAFSNFNLGLGDILPAFIVGGIAALGFGLIKGFRKIFRKKNLNFPTLKLLRKVRKEKKATRTGGLFGRSANMAKEKVQEFQEAFKGKRLGKSRDKVLMGVAGGIAQYSGFSASLVRLMLMVAFFFTGGIVAVIYVLLGLLLPENRTDRLNRSNNP